MSCRFTIRTALLALVPPATVVASVLAACSAGTGPSGDPDGGQTTDALTKSDSQSAGCPSGVPTAGASCSPDGTNCTYGCDTYASCSGGKWSVAVTDQVCTTQCGPSLQCPAYCVIVSGGPAPACLPVDGGTCPAAKNQCGTYDGGVMCADKSSASYSCAATKPEGATCEGMVCSIAAP